LKRGVKKKPDEFSYEPRVERSAQILGRGERYELQENLLNGI